PAWSEGDSTQTVAIDNTQFSEVGQGSQEAVEPTVAVNSTSTSNRPNSKRPFQDATNTQQAKRAAVTEPNVVEQYLNRTLFGKTCIKAGKKGTLNESERQKFCNDIIWAELGDDPEGRILEPRFKFLASSIVDLFPSEIEATYYTPRVPKTKESDAIQPKGILYDKYHNNLKFLRLHGMRCSIRSKQPTDEDPDDPCVATPHPEEKSALEWLLKLSFTCQEETVVKWKVTSAYRQNLLWNVTSRNNKNLNKDLKIATYFKQFPCLEQQWGLKLVRVKMSYIE
ncbi:putative cobalamin biosynthesis protein CobD, partial [Frankliniella fusca]